MNSSSPGTSSNAPERQSCLARSILSSELETKFHQMWRRPMCSPPITMTLESSENASVYASLGEAAEDLRARLRQVVQMELMSDVPVGVLLSGGVEYVFDA